MYLLFQRANMYFFKGLPLTQSNLVDKNDEFKICEDNLTTIHTGLKLTR